VYLDVFYKMIKYSCCTKLSHGWSFGKKLLNESEIEELIEEKNHDLQELSKNFVVFIIYVYNFIL